MEQNTGYEAWKMSVVRASSYIQSNASFQIQMFGFYISAVIISYGTSSSLSQPLLLAVVVPVLSLFVLLASGFYFNRLTVQHVFIRCFGHNFDASAKVKSHDQLWTDLKNSARTKFQRKIKYLFTSDYTGPYPYFFVMYNIIGLSSFLYANYPTSNGKKYVIFNLWCINSTMMLCADVVYIFCGILISTWLTAEMAGRAWKALAFEEEYELKKRPS